MERPAEMKTQFCSTEKATMLRKFIFVLLACWFVATGTARAQSLDQEMSRLADQISKSLVTQGFKSVAAIDFTDLQGQPTELGRFLAEGLAVDIVSSGGVSMVDRANIKSILAEHKLTEEGLVNPENAKKLGEFAGVDVILTGNATALDDGIVLMVKAVATSSSRIVAAGRIKFPMTSEIQQLLNRSISGGSSGSVSPAIGGGDSGGASFQNSSAIATKDLGSLRVVLKSVLPVGPKDQRTGLQVSFELTNLRN
jgi:TolB-like protein